MDESIRRFIWQGIQAWDRYSYTNNNPIKYIDPTGHSACDQIPAGPSRGACESGGYGAAQRQLDKEKEYQQGNDPCFGFAGLNNDICERGKETREPSVLNWPRPVSGIHGGISIQADFFLGGGGYLQGDLLMDWEHGTLYGMVTAGVFGYAGTPSVISGEGYVGTTEVYGIPSEPDDISQVLGGENWDSAAQFGGDAMGTLGVSKGLSVDLNSAHKPVYSRDAGYQYAVENSVNVGFNLVPNAVEAGAETGLSYSVAAPILQLWPFR